MVKFFGLISCIVAAALLVGVHSDCLSIATAVVEARSDSEIAVAFASAYSNAMLELPEGECSEQDTIEVAKKEAIEVVKAVVDVFTFTLVKVEGDEGCVGEAKAKADASASATAQTCASAHVAAIALNLGGYFPLSLSFAESKSAASAFEQVFSAVFSDAQVVGQGIDYDLDQDKQEIVATAIAEVFAKAVATYKGPEGESYCPL